MSLNYDTTMHACFRAYVVQAIINSYAPLLFVIFQDQFDIPLSWMTLLITFNFLFQLMVDLISAFVVDKIGHRKCLWIAHIMACLGLCALAILPQIMVEPFIGLLISVCLYAIGGGLLEVLVSPVLEALPFDHKASKMSLLHSFYCWGYMAVVIVSTGFFAVFGTGNWPVLTLLWALFPLWNLIPLLHCPMVEPKEQSSHGLTIRQLFSNSSFWLLMVVMVCAGASELSISQWASAFAEAGLNVDKTIGDLFGPCGFALMMGISRTIYGKYGHMLNLNNFMKLSAVLCIIAYLLIGLSPWPWLSLIGCMLCGFSVGIFWPGTFSKAAVVINGGGTAMFALLALGGDIGCSLGPTIVGMVSGIVGNDLQAGLLCAIIFPIILLMGLTILQKQR